MRLGESTIRPRSKRESATSMQPCTAATASSTSARVYGSARGGEILAEDEGVLALDHAQVVRAGPGA